MIESRAGSVRPASGKKIQDTMETKNTRERSVILGVGAVFNFAAAAILAVLVRIAPEWLAVVAIDPVMLMFADLLCALVAGFGVAYAFAWADFDRYRPFVGLGVGCKVAVVLVVAFHLAFGTAPLLVVLLASGDLVFAVLYLRLLTKGQHRH